MTSVPRLDEPRPAAAPFRCRCGGFHITVTIGGFLTIRRCDNCRTYAILGDHRRAAA